MSQTKQTTTQHPVTGTSDNQDVVDTIEDATAEPVQTLLEMKAAAAKNRYQPPSNPWASHKGKKIGNPPRGTRKSMGKR